jgi:hypothetical protein
MRCNPQPGEKSVSLRQGSKDPCTVASGQKTTNLECSLNLFVLLLSMQHNGGTDDWGRFCITPYSIADSKHPKLAPFVARVTAELLQPSVVREGKAEDVERAKEERGKESARKVHRRLRMPACVAPSMGPSSPFFPPWLAALSLCRSLLLLVCVQRPP